jgi:glycosyltransferase involved in cell wall biosynthesis
MEKPLRPRKSVLVIISSYNSRIYIRQQLDSILNQDGIDVRIWIRDDGSEDDTLEIIDQYCKKDSRITVTAGGNLGPCRSFLTAIYSCPIKADYFAFADADDVWNNDKLAHSVALIESNQGQSPTAVATRVEVVNAQLQHIMYSRIPRVGFTFNNALIETLATGMTIVMNPAAFTLLRSRRPNYAVMHDAWIYLLITAFGKFIYSPRPTVKYRQHDSNFFGAGHSLKKRMRLRWGKLWHLSPFRRQALEFLELHGQQLDKDKFNAISRYCNYSASTASRVAFMINPSIVKQHWLSNIYMRLLIILGVE